MKVELVLLVLLNVLPLKVRSQPYPKDSNGKCRDRIMDYAVPGSNLCCKKCPPGERVKQKCSENNDTECEQCPKGQFMENRNYADTCRSCIRCKEIKGLQYAQNCSSTTMSKCMCQPGMYCNLGFDDPYCEECRKYKKCGVGFGVSVPGTGDSNVKCAPCSDGTFSDTVSYTDPCRPHTNCHGKAVVKTGNATSDTECESEPPSSIIGAQTTPKETTAAATMNNAVDPKGQTVPPLYDIHSVSAAVFNNSTKSPATSALSDGELAAVIAPVIGFTLLFIAIILVCLCKTVRKKDAAGFHPKIDANGNCEAGEKIHPGYLGETQLTSFKNTSSEQQCLLEQREASSEQSQSSTRQTDGSSSEESIGPLQSTVCLSPPSALSEPMSLLSNTDLENTQTSIPAQASSLSSQSTVTTSPQVNVNITFNIGNSSAGTQPVIPVDLMQADLMQADSELPFGEEESFSIPQQEDGKQSLVSEQESES
ncbi:tumor necrosis factor receptor superfamily member 1B isoform X2 [Halichoeres trimaculatus]|uniref:tumor necrosis factor receptor superfamily member 1B isoform X2 n=1 Tax=Halichoeres trimaculatus TaxID=147232 RepID=UPI003D9E67C1